MSTQLAELKNLNKTIPKEFFKAMERWVFSDKDSEYKEREYYGSTYDE